MVAGRGLAVRAVRQDLLVHLAQQLAQSERAPRRGLAQFRQEQAEPEQARHVREVVVARGDVRELEVATDVPPVRVEERERRGEAALVQCGRAPQQLEAREQIHRAQGDLHRARPVRPEARGVLPAPALDLREELFGETFVARERVGAREHEQVAEPVQLPQHAHVRAVAAHERHVAVVGERPARARHRLAQPVNLGAEVQRPVAQQRPAVRDHPARLFRERRDSLVRQRRYCFGGRPAVSSDRARTSPRRV